MYDVLIFDLYVVNIDLVPTDVDEGTVLNVCVLGIVEERHDRT